MHGRVKVRSSEEEKRIKEIERQKKLAFYRLTMGKINEKRQENQLDEEMLSLTGQLLYGNPDIYTLWNIRREVLINITKRENASAETLCQLYDKELQMTESCLRVNPKSYCAWHQRSWVLDNRSDPNWKHELDLCNLYLRLDERNFHTWDYRRIVVSKYKSPLKDEFDFTTEKIMDNFSNYSSWHYRSNLLLSLHPDSKGGRPIAEERHKKELEMVISAAFTDPSDTSAWFYQRWLLGAVKIIKKIVICSVNKDMSLIALNKTMSIKDIQNNVAIYVNGQKLSGSWKSCNERKLDVVWLYYHSEIIPLNGNSDIKVVFEWDGNKQKLNCTNTNPDEYVAIEKFEFNSSYPESVVLELKSQLESCQQLLELEPDDKWTLLGALFLMSCLNPKENNKEIMDIIAKLKKKDPMRKGYYEDMASRWTMENFLQNQQSTNSVEYMDITNGECKISALYHMQYWSVAKYINLSNQNLTSQFLPALISLQKCEVLDLSNNLLSDLEDFPKLPLLKTLQVTGNSIDSDSLEKTKHKFASVFVII